MMKHQIFKALFAVAALFAVLASPAGAEVKLDIRKGSVEPMPIAVSDMVSSDELGAQISAVITADLKRSGFFLPVEAAGVMASIAGIGELAKEAQARGLGDLNRPRGSVPTSGG